MARPAHQIPSLSAVVVVGRRVRAHFAEPLNLGVGTRIARIEGILGAPALATFARRTISLHDISAAFDPEERDVTEDAGLLGAFVTADLRNLTALVEVVDLSGGGAIVSL
jgi:hypothetical protein